MDERYKTFQDFYPFYLNEHRNGTCRTLHFMGSFCVLSVLAAALVMGRWQLFMLMPVAGYGFAWVGHFFFEKNRPATFKYPLYSLVADWVMMKDILLGRIPMSGELPLQ
jgi:hypothetical protein